MNILIGCIIGAFIGQFGVEYFKDVPDYTYAGTATLRIIEGMITYYITYYIIDKFLYKKDL